MGRLDWRLGALLALSSCIIYRVEPEPEREPAPRDPVEVPEPAPLPSDLRLVFDEGSPGETLRTTLVTDEPRGLEGLQAVRFERDVTVVDARFDDAEAELVVAIAETAGPGKIDLTAQFREGATVRIGDAFTILAPETGITGDTGGSATPTGDTGAGSTGDTGSTSP